MSTATRQLDDAARRRRGLSASEREISVGRLMLIPALIAPVALACVFLAGIYVTLFNWRLTGGEVPFVGLNNYVRVLSDPKFWRSMFLTLKFALMDVSIEVILGTAMAWCWPRPCRGFVSSGRC